MSYQERENLISLITTFVVSVPYYIYTYLKFEKQDLNDANQLIFLAKALLVLIVIRIVSQIIIMIIATIVTAIITQKKDEKQIKDERDNLISLKSLRNAYYAFILSFIISIILVSMGKSASLMFLILMIGGFCSELVEIFSKMIYYKKGY